MENTHWLVLAPGDKFEHMGNLFEVATEPYEYPSHNTVGAMVATFQARALEIRDSESMRPFVTEVGHLWTMQIRSDLAYMAKTATPGIWRPVKFP